MIELIEREASRARTGTDEDLDLWDAGSSGGPQWVAAVLVVMSVFFTCVLQSNAASLEDPGLESGNLLPSDAGSAASGSLGRVRRVGSWQEAQTSADRAAELVLLGEAVDDAAPACCVLRMHTGLHGRGSGANDPVLPGALLAATNVHASSSSTFVGEAARALFEADCTPRECPFLVAPPSGTRMDVSVAPERRSPESLGSDGTLLVSGAASDTAFGTPRAAHRAAIEADSVIEIMQ
jgi:hypothetical protein